MAAAHNNSQRSSAKIIHASNCQVSRHVNEIGIQSVCKKFAIEGKYVIEKASMVLWGKKMLDLQLSVFGVTCIYTRRPKKKTAVGRLDLKGLTKTKMGHGKQNHSDL